MTKAKVTTSASELICGKTIEQLEKMPGATLAQIAKLHGKRLGTEIHFPWFHFLKRDEALRLLVIGDNSDPEAAEIVAAKIKQMETNRQFDGSAIREWHAKQKVVRNEIENELVQMYVDDFIEAGSDPDFNTVEKKLRSQVVLAYNAAITAADKADAKEAKKAGKVKK